MNTLPEVLQNKIFNYAAQMAVAERNSVWKRIHQDFHRSLLYHAEPYMTLTPEVFGWGLCLQHGPYKNWLMCIGLITEERSPLDL